MRVSASENAKKDREKTFFGEIGHTKGLVTGQYWVRFRVFFMAFRVLGNMPYSISPDGERIVKSVWASLWAVVAAVVQVVALRLSVVLRNNNPRFWSTYQNVIDSFVRLFIGSSTIHFLASWWQMSQIINYINTWQAYSIQYEYITGSPISTSTPSTAAWALLLSVLAAPLMVVTDYVFLQPQFEPWYLFPLILARFYSVLLIFFWVANCIFLIQTARNLKRCFSQMLSSSPHPDLVNSYRLLWLGLRHRVADLGSSFSGVLTLILLTFVVSFVFSSYNMLSVLIEGHYTRMREFLVPWMYSWICIIVVCFCSHQVFLECGTYFLMNILQTKFRSLQATVVDQIEVFLDTVEANSTDVVLAHCIVLNRPSFLRVVSMAMLYLVIFVQFNSKYLMEKVKQRAVVPFYW